MDHEVRIQLKTGPHVRYNHTWWRNKYGVVPTGVVLLNTQRNIHGIGRNIPPHRACLRTPLHASLTASGRLRLLPLIFAGQRGELPIA